MNMLKFFVSGLLMMILAGVGAAAGSDDIAAHRDCAHCGMDRKVYGYSRMLLEYAGGVQVGLCSLHCAAVELNAGKGEPVKLLVADRDSHELMEAARAVWVMGGSKRGVMTKEPKWAFATEQAARSFIAANGGRIVSWEEALAAAKNELGRFR